MKEKYLYTIACFMMYILTVMSFAYNKYSDKTCTSGNIIIHAIGSSVAFTDVIGMFIIYIFLDSQTWYGLLLWKEANKDGLCLGGTVDSNGVCSVERNKICLLLFELVDSVFSIFSNFYY